MVAGVGGNSIFAAVLLALLSTLFQSVSQFGIRDTGLRGETLLGALVVLWGSWVAGSFGMGQMDDLGWRRRKCGHVTIPKCNVERIQKFH